MMRMNGRATVLVIDALGRNQGRASTDGLKAETGLKAIEYPLKRMRDEGYVTHIARGEYELTGKGWEAYRMREQERQSEKASALAVRAYEKGEA